jgi:hypothetical protein
MTSDPRDTHDGRPIDPDLSAVQSAWSELEQCEPPELLDQAVLNAARRQIERSRRRRSMGWLGAFATAAVVVLTLAIVVRQDLPGPVLTPPETDGFRLDLDAAAPKGATGEAKIMHDEPAVPLEQAKRMSSAAPAASEAPRLLREERQAVSPETIETLEADAEEIPDPEAWIECLLKLHEAGRADELEAELAAFRRAWPDYPLPPELFD